MKTQSTLLALVLALTVAPVSAQRDEASRYEPQQGQGMNDLFTKQNIGRAVGGVVGGLVGSRFGGGKGKVAMTAAGALAGFFLGGAFGERLEASDQQALARTTNTALDTGNTQTWQNPDTGVSTRVSVEDTRVERRPVYSEGLQARLREAPPLDMVNAYYLADSDSNVRGGPGTEYDVMGVMRAGERVAVVGKVRSANWYMISDDGLGSGFVYAPLLRLDASQPEHGSAVREVAGQDGTTHLADERTCSLVTQQVTLADGTSESHQMTACRQADGTWVQA